MEIQYVLTDDLNLDGRDISLHLQNYSDYQLSLTDIGSQYPSLAEMLTDSPLADDDAFSPCETYNTNNTDVYTIEPGSLHIPVGASYPGCYIDNVGIHTFGPDKKEALYLGISIDNYDSWETLKNLTILNKCTAEWPTVNINSIARLGSDRLILAVVPAYDNYMKEQYDSVDTFLPEMLTQYTLACMDRKSSGESVSFDVNWDFNMTIQLPDYK